MALTAGAMSPEITHGDMIALKEVKDWDIFLPMGEIYAIVTKNDICTIKRIGKGGDTNTYMLIPTNKSAEYAEINLYQNQ